MSNGKFGERDWKVKLTYDDASTPTLYFNLAGESAEAAAYVERWVKACDGGSAVALARCRPPAELTSSPHPSE